MKLNNKLYNRTPLALYQYYGISWDKWNIPSIQGTAYRPWRKCGDHKTQLIFVNVGWNSKSFAFNVLLFLAIGGMQVINEIWSLPNIW